MREKKINPYSNASIIRVHKNKNYTVMSNQHLFQRDLSLKAKGLMSLFLALPSDWEYSISGLCKMGKEGKDAINAAIAELKSFGYIEIERKNAEKGRFIFIYHIFEEGKENLPYTGFPYTDKPLTVQPCTVLPSTDNPQQLNTNILSTNELNTNNQTHVKTTSVFTPDDLFNLYLEICIDFPKPRELTNSRRQKARKRIDIKPMREFWEIVCRNAQNSDFIRSGNWFCFDWIIKNDTNPLKVYEGNYNNKNSAELQQKLNSSCGKYSNCYHNEDV